MKRLLALGYLHVIFPLKARFHFAKSQPLHATKIKDDKYELCFRETKYIKNHPKVSITDST